MIVRITISSEEDPLTISIIVAVVSLFVACLITAFEPKLSAWNARLALRQVASVQPHTDTALAKRRWPRRSR
jgi:hypothetical protein